MSFTDPAAVATYAGDAARRVPGLADLHRMVALLLAETAPPAARILVVGAGGGMEVSALAEAHPGWSFFGVDPSPAMLDLARAATAPVAERVTLAQGTVEDAPDGPFDGATCLLVLHFLDRATRLATLRAIRARLHPGAALIIAHHAPPAGPWLARTAAFVHGPGVDPAQAEASARTMAERLPLLSPEAEEAFLHEAGFTEVALFWAALSFRGWIAR